MIRSTSVAKMFGYTLLILISLSSEFIGAQNIWLTTTTRNPFRGQASIDGESYNTNQNTPIIVPARKPDRNRYDPAQSAGLPVNEYQNPPKNQPIGPAQPVQFEDRRQSGQQKPQQIPQGNSISKVPNAPSPPPSQNQGQQEFRYDDASFAVTELARRIGEVLGQQSNAGIFSPVSIACALSLLLLGSNGATKEELSQAMGFNVQRLNEIHRQYGHLLNNLASTSPDKYPITWRRNDRCSEDDEEDEIEKQVINLANAIFVRHDLNINPRFVDLSNNIYNSSLVPLNFAENPQQAAADINHWASQKTFGKINQIVSEYLNPDTQMIVANALYFKGLWKNTFEVQATSLKKFFPNGYDRPESAKEIPSMLAIGCYPFYDGTDDFNAKIIGLPYQGEKTALYIIVPNNSNRQVLLNFQRNLDAAKIGTMVSRMAVKKALIQIPKMKISNTLNLRDVLQQMNVRNIFSPVSSDLSPMLSSSKKGPKQPQNQQQRLFASEIVHKVELDINEKGTEGGAITASTIFRSLPSVQMRIDTPFLMLLGHDETRLPLFYGTVFDPTG
ncbi:serine protease inhibitor 28Dc-like [Uranotaenia lowii]|uniref:serine protease inhibitor 28Dc-like n=1 Tax=Uranotaenia lowii TaxID=190385 RepID=UPI00247AD422|nr:serine protease inhibitor 28Dc-like [Uranotaenia lowii]